MFQLSHSCLDYNLHLNPVRGLLVLRRFLPSLILEETFGITGTGFLVDPSKLT